MKSAAKKSAGKVWLVGAGPGDPELLTLKAVKAIAAADVLLVDDLVNPQILAHAAAQAHLLTPLGALADDLAASNLSSPSIIVVGDVVRCADVANNPLLADNPPRSLQSRL